MGFLEPSVLTVFAEMTTKFATVIELDVLYTLVTKMFVMSSLYVVMMSLTVFMEPA